MVVAHQGEHAAMPRGTGEIDVAEHIAAAVDAGALAVPERENAVEAAFAAHFGLLRAPDGGRGQVLVEAGLKQDVVGFEDVSGANEIMIEAAERGTGIARDEPRRIQSGAAVERLLHEEEPRHGLRTGDIDPPFGEVVFIGEGNDRENELDVRSSVPFTTSAIAFSPAGAPAGSAAAHLQLSPPGASQPTCPVNPYRTGRRECQDFRASRRKGAALCGGFRPR